MRQNPKKVKLSRIAVSIRFIRGISSLPKISFAYYSPKTSGRTVPFRVAGLKKRN